MSNINQIEAINKRLENPNCRGTIRYLLCALKEYLSGNPVTCKLMIEEAIKESDEVSFTDITAPQICEVLIRKDKKVLWINVDGICRLRACQIKELVVNTEG